MTFGGRTDRLSDTDRAAAAAETRAKTERHLGTVFQKPFCDGGAVLEPGGGDRRAEFAHRIVKGKGANALVPIRFWSGSAAWIQHNQNREEQPGVEPTEPGTNGLHGPNLPDGRWKSTI